MPVIVIAILALVPIVRWFYLEPMSFRFFDLNSTTTSFGQIAGLLGMMLFSINLILSNRNKFFDKIFSGLHIFYDHHKWVGSLAFSLLLFHPLFLVVKYLGLSVHDAALFLIPSGNFAITLGIIALVGMIGLLSLTLYFKIKYHIWRFSHKFMVVVFVFALFHTMLISSDISRDAFLRFYVLIFAFIGLLLGSYRALFRFFFNRDFEFKVVEINNLNSRVTEIEIEPTESVLDFHPGQFIFLRFVGVGFSSESHPFSITSVKGEDNLKIAIKSLGDYTKKIGNLKEGTLAKVEGPYGGFFQNRDLSKKEIWIAGGVGITPFLSLARSLQKAENDIYLFYCLNDKNEAVFLDELLNIQRVHKKVHIIPWYSSEKGRINGEAIKELAHNISDADIYLCGPVPFMRSLRKQFIKKGVDKNNIHFEEFNFL